MTVTTRLRPGQVMKSARDYFGPSGKVGLELTEPGVNRLLFQGGSGHIAITIYQVWNGTRLELESWQFDTEAQAFVNSLPPPGGKFSQVWKSFRGRRSRGRGDRGGPSA